MKFDEKEKLCSISRSGKKNNHKIGVKTIFPKSVDNKNKNKTKKILVIKTEEIRSNCISLYQQ